MAEHSAAAGGGLTRRQVLKLLADTTCVLRLIQARFGLQPLTHRGRDAYDLRDGLDFSQRPREFALG